MFLFYFLLLYFLCFLRDRRGGHWGNSRGGSERQESQDWRAHSSRAIVNFFLVTTAGRWSTRTTGWPTCPKPPEFSHVKVCGQWLGWSYLATRVFTQVLSPIEKAPVKHAFQHARGNHAVGCRWEWSQVCNKKNPIENQSEIMNIRTDWVILIGPKYVLWLIMMSKLKSCKSKIGQLWNK